MHFPTSAWVGEFWEHMRDFVRGTMIAEGTISPEDLDLIQPAVDADEALRIISEAS